MECEKCRLTHRDEKSKEAINKRLKRINGQIVGIEKMIDDDRYCGDILIQLLAVNNSIKSLANVILENHLKTCVTEDIKNDKEGTIDEVMNLIRRFQ